MILYESISWKGPFSASIVSSLSQPGCLSKAAHLCHGFLHGHLGVVFFGCRFFALKSGNNKSWYSETHIYFLDTLPPPKIGNMAFVFTKTTRVAALPANSGTFTTSNFWTCAGTPRKQWETFMSSFNGVVKALQVSQEKSHNQAVNNLLVTVIQEAQSWQSIWVNMVLLAVSRLQPAGCRLEVGGNSKLSLFFCALRFARLTISGRKFKGLSFESPTVSTYVLKIITGGVTVAKRWGRCGRWNLHCLVTGGLNSKV